MTLHADVIVVGTGPGGATVARELARGGRRVLLLERGEDHRGRAHYGTYVGAMQYADRASLLFSREGMQIVRPLMVGGATSMYCGCAARPPAWLRTRYGLDVEAEAAETIEELEIAPLPANLRGAASTRLAEAGRSLGYDFAPQQKFMRPARARRGGGAWGSLTPPRVGGFGCGAHCMLGCSCGAKWSAAEYVDDAVAAGASLVTGALVERVLLGSGQAEGVVGRIGRRTFIARAEEVVLAAGGIGTPRILQASGFAEAGRGATMDATLMVYGITSGEGIGSEPPMTWNWHDPDDRFMLSTLIDPWLLYPITTLLSGPRHLPSWRSWGNTIGVMIKLRDQLSGGVGPRAISKPLIGQDRAHLAEARQIAERLLREAGAKPDSIFATPLRGTHPGSTARVGTLLDTNFETATRGLFVCDASAFPEALGRPTVLTIIGMGKRLARWMVGC
jgi:choline dehydrogenase-like flavoprotein